MKTLSLSFKVNTEPDMLYRAMVTPQTIELWSGYPAVMSETPGSEFEWFDGDIVGKNLEFEPDNLIRQEWYFGENTEPSVVTLNFIPLKDTTQVNLEQTNIPDDSFENIKYGWKKVIFASLKEFFRE